MNKSKGTETTVEDTKDSKSTSQFLESLEVNVAMESVVEDTKSVENMKQAGSENKPEEEDDDWQASPEEVQFLLIIINVSQCLISHQLS